MSDPVHHPAHYSSDRFGIECIEFARHMTFCQGNAFKYVWRHARKGGAEDLRKAVVYLKWAIEQDERPDYSSESVRILRGMANSYLSGSAEARGVYRALIRIATGEYSYAIPIINTAIYYLEKQP